MELVNTIQFTRNEINLLIKKLEKLETELYHESKKNKKNCEHKKIYKYVLEKEDIYTCKKCRNNLKIQDINNKSKIKIRSFV